MPTLLTGELSDRVQPRQSATTARTAPRRDNCFDFLRLFAALAVVVSHSVEHLGVPFLWVGAGGPWFYDGVPLFFIISGFLVFRSYERCVEAGRPVRQFYVNRFLRVAPALYVYVPATVVLLLCLGALTNGALRSLTLWLWALSHYVLVPVYHPAIFEHVGVGRLNGSLWTIPVECSFYAVVPACFWLYRRIGVSAASSALAILALIGLIPLASWPDSAGQPLGVKLLRITFLPWLVFFAVGVFWSRTWRAVPHSGWFALAGIALYALVRPFSFIAGVWLGPVATFAWAIPLSYAVIWFAYYGPAVLSRLTGRIGDLSYGTYIWHMIVVNVVLYEGVHHGLSYFQGNLLVAGVAATVLLVAAASWWLVEKPALAWKPFTSRPSATTA